MNPSWGAETFFRSLPYTERVCDKKRKMKAREKRESKKGRRGGERKGENLSCFNCNTCITVITESLCTYLYIQYKEKFL